MKLIIDISNLLHSAFKMNWTEDKDLKELENICRHMIITTIYTKLWDLKVAQEDVIIAVDSRTWRKDYFPLYKHNRKIAKEKSEIDAELMYEFFDTLMMELNYAFPFHVIKVNKCEADDIIGVLARYISEKNKEEVVIISRDKDFLQLINKKISLFDPFEDDYTTIGKVKNHKMSITTAYDAKIYKMLHILIGDTTDGIMNVLSPDHILAFPKMVKNKKGDKMIKERQEALGWKRIEKELFDEDGKLSVEKYKEFIKQTKYIEDTEESYRACKITEEEYKLRIKRHKAVKKNWIRNKTLIDLEMVPIELKEEIVEKYKYALENATKFDFNLISKYFTNNDLNELNMKLMTGRLVRVSSTSKKLF